MNKQSIYFERAGLRHEKMIFQWLDGPHIKEFWDNSPEHRKDIAIFIRGRKEPTPYHDGIFTYWIGSIDDVPYCLLMTSEVLDVPNLPEGWREYLSKSGTTCSIDFAIGNANYLGKGHAPKTLKVFTQFIKKEIDPTVDTFIIDPNQNNPKAKHVYEKAGFTIVSEFSRNNERYYLMIKHI